MPDELPPPEGVAIVGLAGRFPGARDTRELWRNLCAGVESITTFSEDELRTSGIDPALVADADYVRTRAILDDADKFDAAFFGVTPHDAELTDPQHRVFLECAWHALEDAGLDPQRYRGSIGVYAGSSLNTYLLDNIATQRDRLADFVAQFQSDGYPLLLGSDKDYLATRVSYKLDLRGPSLTVQCACSTSLVAVVQAVNALLSYQCDAALAGGVSITFPQARGHLFQDGAILSSDGHCRPYDAKADGTVFGHGCGVVVLKRLADALTDRDHIYAVIKGAAVNNDGAGKVSYMAPSVDGQAEVISLAHALAGVTADTIDFVEGHGTATPLGDPIEVSALTQAFRATTDAVGFCKLGTVKSNFGHLEAAAGVTGLIKTALAIEQAQIPPTLHFHEPNPHIEFAKSPFEVSSELTPWPQRNHPRRAGVSSFGVGGTNAHVVVEQSPSAPTKPTDEPQLIVLSAKSRYALEEATTQLGRYLREHPELALADVAFTLQTGRRSFEHRRFVIARTTTEAAKLLLRRDRRQLFTNPMPGKPAPEIPATADALAAQGWRWLLGAEVDFTSLHETDGTRRVSLPGYVFERKRFWIEPQRATKTTAPIEATPVLEKIAEVATEAVEPIESLKAFLVEQSGLDLSGATPSTSLLDLGFDSLFLTQIAIALQRRYGVRITLRQLLGDLADLGPLSAFLEANRAGVTPASGAAKAVAIKPATAPAGAPQHGPFRPLQKDLGGVLTPKQESWLEDFIARYAARTPKSKSHTQEHRAHFADPRAVAGFKQVWKEMVYPIVVDRSQGAHLWDIDGHDYVDTTQGFGLALFGHQPAFAVRAIEEQMKHGMEIGPSHPLAGEVAHLLCEITGHERATFCNTGSEAVLGAIRIARTVTGRNKIALFAGAYHGINDEALVRPLVVNGEWRTAPIAPGILQDAVDNVLVLDYGNPESLEIIRRHASDLAAVLVEPVQSRRPDLQPREFLHQLRALTAETGVAMVMDEVITGFRCHPGGAQAYFGVKGDIATYGKVIGGGLPIGAITGRAEYMDAFDGGAWQFGDDSYPTAGVTFFAGTFVRHPLALAAAKAVLVHLKESGERLQNELAERTSAMIREIAPALKGTPYEVPHFASVFYVRAHDFKYTGLLYALLRYRGIHIWEGRPCFLGTAHTAEDIAAIVRAFHESLAELRDAGFFETNRQPVLVEKAVAEGVTPLTEAQREIWLATQLGDRANSAFNETCTLEFRGPVDEAALRQAVADVVARHDALRATFLPDGSGQRFSSAGTFDVALHDLTSLAPAERDTRFAALRASEGARVFDLTNGPVAAFQIVRLGANHAALMCSVHHLACDGWSYDILLRELALAYSARVTKHLLDLAPALQFAEYASQEDERQASAERLDAEAYWVKCFRTLPEPLQLPTDHPRAAARSFAGARTHITLPAELHEQLAQLGRQHGSTPFAVLFASFAALLQRLSGRDDLVIGIMAAGQNVIGSKDLIGHCANLLPLRLGIDANRPFTDLLKTARESILDAFDHQQFTFGTLLQRLNVRREAGHVPLVPVIFNLDPPLSDIRFHGLEYDLNLNPRSSYQFDLGFNLVDEGGPLSVECDYNPDLFDEATIQRWLAHYHALLQSFVAEPASPLGQVPLLSEAERWLVIRDWNQTALEFPRDETLPGLFAKSARRSPDAVALLDHSARLTYRELDEFSDRIAQVLLSRGVGVGDRVAVCGRRSSSLVAALLGVLKTGAAYVPIEPDYPAARRAAILQDAGAQFTLSDSRTNTDLSPGHSDITWISWDALPSAGEPVALPRFGSAQLAYILFTSGSTGRPKGVAIEHRNAVAFASWARASFSDEEFSGVLFATSVCFDLSIFEMFATLSAGGTVIVAQNILELPNLPDASAVRLINTVPSAIADLAHRGEIPASVPTINLAGEPLAENLVATLLATGTVRRVNDLYGPTETTTYSTWTQRASGQVANIGRPIANTQIYLLDAHRQPVPIGVAGRLWIAGEGVARGYWGQPEMTAERFVANPFTTIDPAAGSRMYDTGDLASYLPDGRIVYLGRADHQIKLRGFRIERGEIEAVLGEHPGIRSAAVVLREDARHDPQLVAYYTCQPGALPTSTALRDHLGAKLPHYMIPKAYVRLDALPLNHNGKLDLRALPAAEIVESPEADHELPQNSIEGYLVELWEAMLQTRPIGTTANFFDLGGHSLLAAEMLARVQKISGFTISLATFMNGPTIADLAKALGQAEFGTLPDPALLPMNEKGSRPPLFFFHGHVYGGLFFCRAIGQRLGPDQPFYAVHPHGMDGTTPPGSIEDMAAARIKAIRQVQPHGPYYLGGYCNGGYVAIEAARQLEAVGEKVVSVILIAADAGNVWFRSFETWSRLTAGLWGETPTETRQRFLRWRSRFVFLVQWPRLWPALQREAERGAGRNRTGLLGRKLTKAWQHLTKARNGSASTLPLLRATGFAQERPVDPLLQIYHDTCEAYVPKRLSAKIILLWPEDQLPLTPGDPTAEWKSVSRDVRWFQIPGDHRSAVTEREKIEALAEILQQRMGNMVNESSAQPR